GIVARYADRVNVMYAARIVESGTAEEIFGRPRHPYTIGLLRSVPRLDRPKGAKLETIEGLPPNLLDPPTGCRFAARCRLRTGVCDADPALREVEPAHWSACHRAEEIAAGLAEPARVPATVARQEARAEPPPVLEVRNLRKHFEVRGKGLAGGKATVKAVEDVSFDVPAGQTLGLVGESGCGKTTVGRTVLKREEATGGEVRFNGTDIVNASRAEMKRLRTQIQVIFQDPFSSLNPRMTV